VLDARVSTAKGPGPASTVGVAQLSSGPVTGCSIEKNVEYGAAMTLPDAFDQLPNWSMYVVPATALNVRLGVKPVGPHASSLHATALPGVGQPVAA